MSEIDLYNADGQVVGKTELPDGIFGASVREPLLHRAVVVYLSSQRRGTASTKRRSELSYSGSKPWRQKGTGRARAGTASSPLWRHGAKSFGPSPRSYSQRISKKEKRLALISALTLKAKEGRVKVCQNLNLEKPRTKTMVQLLRALELEGKSIIILQETDGNILKSCGNLPGVEVTLADGLSVYGVLNSGWLLLTEDGLQALKKRLGGSDGNA